MGEPELNTTPRRPQADRLLWLCFPLAALLLLWRALLGGEVLLPAEYLKGFTPWAQVLNAAPEQIPQWNVLQWDGMAQFYPWRLELARSLSEGRIPLWNPYVLCGTPFLANSQSAPFYPLHALYALPFGSVAVKMGWMAFLHLSLAGLFAFWLAREYGARPLAAVTTGLAYQLSGFAVAWLELPSFITVACWIPLVVLCLTRAVRRLSVFWTACAAAALGMMLLGGHLQVAFYGLLAAGCTWVWEAVEKWRGERQGGRRAGQVWGALVGLGAAAVAGGLALSAAQFLPSLELSRVSHRVGSPTEAGYGGYVDLAMPVQNWVTLLVPDYYGLPGRSDFWGFWKYLAPNTVEYAGHVGAAAFSLALVGLWSARRLRGRGLWIFLGVLALLMAAGTPVNRLFYFFVPGFAQSGSPARCLVLFCLAQALLAGFGVEALLRSAETGWSRPLKPFGIAAGVTVGLMLALHGLATVNLPAGDLEPIVAALFQVRPEEMMARVSVPALIRAIGFALVPALLWLLLSWLLRENPAPTRLRVLGWTAALSVGGVLLLISGPYNLIAPPELAYPPTPVTDRLAQSGARVATINKEWSLLTYAPAVLPPNASLAYRWRDAQGYDSLALGAYRRLASAVAGPGRDAAPGANGNIVFIKDAAAPLLPLLGTRYVVTLDPAVTPNLRAVDGFPPGPPYVRELVNAVPEAYTVSRWFLADDATAAERLRAAAPAGLANTAVVAEGQPAPRLNLERLDPMPGKAARVERLSAGKLRVSAEPEVPSLLVLTEGVAPGWRVRVQERGEQARDAVPLRTNIGFQGVLVASGPVTAEWRYEPASFRVGLFLSLLTLLVLLTGIVGTYSGRITHRSGARGDAPNANDREAVG